MRIFATEHDARNYARKTSKQRARFVVEWHGEFHVWDRPAASGFSAAWEKNIARYEHGKDRALPPESPEEPPVMYEKGRPVPWLQCVLAFFVAPVCFAIWRTISWLIG